MSFLLVTEERYSHRPLGVRPFEEKVRDLVGSDELLVLVEVLSVLNEFGKGAEENLVEGGKLVINSLSNIDTRE